MDGMLSQEEINALLNGMGPEDETSAEEEFSLSEEEKDAIGEISNISLGTAATALSTLVNHKVDITTPQVSYSTWQEISDSYDRPCVFIQISYREGLDGNNVLILKEQDVKVITDLMMGGDGSNVADELSELHLSAISEAMNQMMGSAATSMSSLLEKKVDISPPSASLVDLNDEFIEQDLGEFMQGQFIKVSFKMVIGDLVDSELMQLYPFDFAQDLYSKFYHIDDATPAPTQSQPAPPPVQQQTPPPVQQQAPQMQQQQAQPMQQQPMQGQPMPAYNMDASMYPNQMPYAQQPMQMPYGMPMQDVNVQPAQFQAFGGGFNPLDQQENIDLIMDVPLEVTVELGRTNKSIKEILEFTPGTIIELNKLAGEPIDVLVNGKFVAKGEVVVIEESFGIRVTEIIR